MQIPTSAGMLANSVLPVTPTQGALLSQVGETAGSTSFAPVEAVSTTYLSRALPEQRPQPSNAPENSGGANSTASNSNGNQEAQNQGAQNQGAQNQGAQNTTTEPSNEPSSTRSSSNDGSNDVPTSEADSNGTDQAIREKKQQARQQEQQQQQDLEIIRSLSQRDAEVHSHENAHSAVGRQYAGSAVYMYERGPDGINYAVSGEVSIDVGVIPGDPQATLEKMEIVQRAALAPAEPSSQDRRVAALAAQQANQARAEIASNSRRSSSNTDEPSAVEKEDKTSIEASSKKESSQPVGQSFAKDDTKESTQDANSERFQAANDRIAKINEILVAISQNDARKVSGQLLDAVV